MTPHDLLWYVQLAQIKEARKRGVAERAAENWRERRGAIYTLDCPPAGIPPQETS